MTNSSNATSNNVLKLADAVRDVSLAYLLNSSSLRSMLTLETSMAGSLGR